MPSSLRQGWGSEPEVALRRGTGAGIAAAAELRGPAHRQRHRRAPRPRRRQPPRPRHVSSPAPRPGPISLSPPIDWTEAPSLIFLFKKSFAENSIHCFFLTLPSPRSWSSRSCWGCHITDEGLIKISSADCVGNLTSISLWGLAGITDKGVVHLVSTGSFRLACRCRLFTIFSDIKEMMKSVALLHPLLCFSFFSI